MRLSWKRRPPGPSSPAPIAILGALALTGYGVYEMLGIVGFSNMTVLQGVMILFFAVTLGWIAFAAASRVAGFLVPAPRGAPDTPIADSRTALLMPIYNEDPTRTTAALQAMAEALAQHDAAQHFEIVIISDSTNADAWIAESLAVDRPASHAARASCRCGIAAAGTTPDAKSATSKTSSKRWGGRYDYMIVLDADSLMAPTTLIELVRRMQADPRLGILQTVPIAHRSREPLRASAAIRRPRVRRS